MGFFKKVIVVGALGLLAYDAVAVKVEIDAKNKAALEQPLDIHLPAMDFQESFKARWEERFSGIKTKFEPRYEARARTKQRHLEERSSDELIARIDSLRAEDYVAAPDLFSRMIEYYPAVEPVDKRNSIINAGLNALVRMGAANELEMFAADQENKRREESSRAGRNLGMNYWEDTALRELAKLDPSRVINFAKSYPPHIYQDLPSTYEYKGLIGALTLMETEDAFEYIRSLNLPIALAQFINNNHQQPFLGNYRDDTFLRLSQAWGVQSSQSINCYADHRRMQSLARAMFHTSPRDAYSFSVAFEYECGDALFRSRGGDALHKNSVAVLRGE